MSSVWDELLGTFTSRVKSRAFGSVVFAFFAINWREIFVLLFSEMSIRARILYFDMNTTKWDCLIFPLMLGFLLTIIMPYLNFVISSLVAWPIYKSRHRDMLAATALAEEKANSELQAEQRRQKLFDVLAKGAVQKAEIEQEISNKNLDTEIANELRKDVEKIKTEVIKKIDQGNDEGGTNEPTLQSLSSFARSMLLEVSADLAKPYIQLNEFLSGGSLQFGASSISQNDVGSQTWQSYIAAIRELERKGLIYRRDAVAPHWQISAKGYEVADKV